MKTQTIEELCNMFLNREDTSRDAQFVKMFTAIAETPNLHEILKHLYDELEVESNVSPSLRDILRPILAKTQNVNIAIGHLHVKE
jgi:hypothetical protein